ncbi:PREDICTED: BURP domain protein USPL1-like [Tarenaya hassleriana]|uniref:BURP domain protein USPL1-like n=1 Tax=Tarenaya hassleriana TaxID=28532 RepID=UPI00053C70E5|nr:PREDICTED: BURP domain protein USPL1-like [Tarenaya hassleriana]
MAAASWLCSIILTLLLSLCAEATMGRKLISIPTKEQGENGHLLTPMNKVKDDDDDDNDDPSLYMYFSIDDLQTTKKLPIYFYKNSLRNLPPLLSKEKADSIPFSRKKLSFLLHYFSISKNSPQGKAMKETLGHCDAKTIEGEVKFCATSLESMLDLVKETLGHDTKLRVLTTRFQALSEKNVSYTLKNYTFEEAPKELVGVRMLGCHRMPYPYVVYYCHGHRGGSRVFEVSLVEADGVRQRVVGPAVCHMDTSTWDKDHVAFKVLKMEPGSAPVCHFFPIDNIVWVTM